MLSKSPDTKMSLRAVIFAMVAGTAAGFAYAVFKQKRSPGTKRKFRQPSPQISAEIARLNKRPRAEVSDFKMEQLDQSSMYIIPKSMRFIWEGKQIRWDLIEGLEAAACMLYHKELESLIFVRQFRPAVYNAKLKEKDLWSHENIVEALAPSEAVTLEFVAGLLDKNKPPLEICAEEAEEEAGYKVSPSDFEFMGCYRRDVGILGVMSHAYYAEVTEAQRVSDGGGTEEESITLEYVHVSDLLKLVNSDDASRPMAPGTKWAIYWFLYHKPEHCFTSN